MTVIAWDGRTLAADKRMSFGSSFAVVTKIVRHQGSLIGCAGDSALCMEMVQWFKDGAAASSLPDKQRTEPCSMVVVSPDGVLRHWCGSHIGRVIEDKHFTIGSGADYAMAAMHLGKTAREAVEVACALDPGCGNGIDTLELE